MRALLVRRLVTAGVVLAAVVGVAPSTDAWKPFTHVYGKRSAAGFATLRVTLGVPSPNGRRSSRCFEKRSRTCRRTSVRRSNRDFTLLHGIVARMMFPVDTFWTRHVAPLNDDA